jgi:serine/threonine-protein kinase
METLTVQRVSIVEQLERVLASESFAGAGRSKVLLRFLVEEALAEHGDRLKEYTIGAEALGRGESFDPRTDPIVRAEASRLRSRLERYYATEGLSDTVLVTLPKGSYVPQFQLRPANGAPPAGGPAAAQAGARWTQRLAWFGLGGAAALAAALLPAFVRDRTAPPPVPPPPFEFDVQLSRASHAFGSDFGNDTVISPDGSRLVFVTRGDDGVLRLRTTTLGRRDIVDLRDTEGARAPFFSPDGAWVAFWADGKLKKVALEGGSPITVIDAVDFGGGAWGDDGLIVAAIGRALVRVSSSPGGPAVPLLDTTKEGIAPRWPQVLPDGRVLYSAVGRLGPNSGSVETLSPSGARTTLVRGGTFGRLLPNGLLAYVNQGTLFARPLEARPEDAGVAVFEDVEFSSTFGFAQFDVSRTGALVARRSAARGQQTVAWIDAAGRVDPLGGAPGVFAFPRFSRDGQRLALTAFDGGALVTSVLDRRSGRVARMPSPPGGMSPLWTPDGRFLVVGSPAGMSWMTSTDATRLTTLTSSGTVQIPSSFSPDGTRLVYHELSPETGFDVWTVPVRVAGGALTVGQPLPFVRTQAYETYGSFSPDGKWIAYGSGQFGVWEVYVRPFPDDGSQPVRVSEGGGRIARWVPGRRELRFRSDDHRIMAVEYELRDGRFVPGKVRQWTPVRLADTGVIANFDLDPLTDRLAGLVPASSEAESRRHRVTVVLHFADEVARRLSRAPR